MGADSSAVSDGQTATDSEHVSGVSESAVISPFIDGLVLFGFTVVLAMLLVVFL